MPIKTLSNLKFPIKTLSPWKCQSETRSISIIPIKNNIKIKSPTPITTAITLQLRHNTLSTWKCESKNSNWKTPTKHVPHENATQKLWKCQNESANQNTRSKENANLETSLAWWFVSQKKNSETDMRTDQRNKIILQEERSSWWQQKTPSSLNSWTSLLPKKTSNSHGRQTWQTTESKSKNIPGTHPVKSSLEITWWRQGIPGQ